MTGISVVMAVRDGAAHLGHAIDSVLAQTYGDFEFLVVDDGSTDESPGIVRRAARRDPRVRQLTSGGVGLAGALNVGVREARGTWIARMDADDVSLPQRFERQLAAASASPDVLAWGTWARVIDELGRISKTVRTGPVSVSEFRSEHHRGTLRFVHPSMLIRREALIDVGGYDEQFRLAQDLDLWDRLGDEGPLLTIPEVLLLFRVHSASATSVDMAGALQMDRFVRARRAAAHRGERLDFDMFVAREAVAPAHRRLARAAHVRARHDYRRAVIHHLMGRRLRAAWALTSALVAHPPAIIARLWGHAVHGRPSTRPHRSEDSR